MPSAARIDSRSATACAMVCGPPPERPTPRGSGNQLRNPSGAIASWSSWSPPPGDAERFGGRVPEGAVAAAPVLLGRLLDDVGIRRLQLLEDAVEVLGGEGEQREGALGHHLGDHPALVVGDARVG